MSQCLICLDDATTDTVATLCCGSQYCRQCLDRWCHSLPVATCPNCRAVIPVVCSVRDRLARALLPPVCALYGAALAYEMYGTFNTVVCRDDWNPVLIAIAVLVTSVLYSVLLLPAYCCVAVAYVVRPWPVWLRFVGMCHTQPLQSVFNYRCHQYSPQLHGWESGVEYVVLGHTVYNRAFECTRYVMTALLIALQLSLIALAVLYWRGIARRQFVARDLEP